jgi:hypothetical protein
MKKIIAVLIFISLGLGNLSFAQTLSAEVNAKQVLKSQGFNLTLELVGADPTDEPDFSALNNAFKVLGRDQSSFTKIINGESSSSVVWTLHLLPLQSGSVEIPAFSVRTNQGLVSSQPLFLNIEDKVASGSRGSSNEGMSFKANVSQSNVYQDQPVVVTYQLRSSRELTQAQLGELSAKDMIIEKVGEPIVKVEVSNGKPVQVLNASYRVTSLKSGDLSLPPLVIQGMAKASRKSNPSLQNQFPSLNDDDDDVFSSMRALMQNFNQGNDLFSQFTESEPITIASAPVSLHVLPPVSAVEPWLPAEYIGLSKKMSTSTFKVGEPFEMVVTLKALGVDASQLPSVEDQLRGDNFKVYADQPEIFSSKEKIQLESTKIEKFTLIPQKQGDLKIPEIKIAWWDTAKGVARTASIPETLIHALPGVLPDPVVTEKTASVADGAHAALPQNQNFSWLQLFLFLCCGGVAALTVRKIISIRILPNANRTGVENISKKIGQKDLVSSASLQSVKEFIEQYSTGILNMPTGLSISRILEIESSYLPSSELVRARAIIKTIESGLYFNSALDLEKLKQELQWLFFETKKRKQSPILRNHFDGLNPT